MVRGEEEGRKMLYDEIMSLMDFGFDVCIGCFHR